MIYDIVLCGFGEVKWLENVAAFYALFNGARNISKYEICDMVSPSGELRNCTTF